jgi:hypothetical protein
VELVTSLPSPMGNGTAGGASVPSIPPHGTRGYGWRFPHSIIQVGWTSDPLPSRFNPSLWEP